MKRRRRKYNRKRGYTARRKRHYNRRRRKNPCITLAQRKQKRTRAGKWARGRCLNPAGMNLDDENEVKAFIERFWTTKGAALARRLGLTGKGAVDRANDLSGYAWNKLTAMRLRKDGRINEALHYEAICDRIYDRMNKDDKW